MAAHDPATRVAAATAAALTRWGRTGSTEARREATRPATEARMARYEAEADPEGKLTLEERRRAAESLLRAHMIRMSLKAKAARRKARQNTADAEAAEAELAALGGDAA